MKWLCRQVVGGAADSGPALWRRARDLTSALEALGAARARAHSLLTAALQRYVRPCPPSPLSYTHTLIHSYIHYYKYYNVNAFLC